MGSCGDPALEVARVCVGVEGLYDEELEAFLRKEPKKVDVLVPFVGVTKVVTRLVSPLPEESSMGGWALETSVHVDSVTVA